MLSTRYQRPAPSGLRRIVVRHTAGPYPGLRQIIGTFTAEDAEQGRIPDVLPSYPNPPGRLAPDNRLCRLLRLQSTDRAVWYVEQGVEAVAGPVATPDAEDRAL